MQGFLSCNVSLGRVAGIQVRLHWLFVLLIASAVFVPVLYEPGVAWWWATLVGVLVVSVVIHEVAHCVIARRRGGSPHEIVLWPMGGLVQVSAPRTAANEVVVALAGPLANALLAAAGALLLYCRSSPSADDGAWSWWRAIFVPPMEADPLSVLGVVRLATWTNLWLAGLNLLPAVPMDGGRAMRGLLWGLVGYRRAVRYTHALRIASAATTCLAPALLRSQGIDVDPLIELPVVGLGILLFFGAREEAGRRKPREESPPEVEEWRVYSAELTLASDEALAGPSTVGQAVEARLEEKLHRQREQEEEEDRRVDEILSRLHVAGSGALSQEDQALLTRVSARYRGRKGK
jgi:Zn-dependent protease